MGNSCDALHFPGCGMVVINTLELFVENSERAVQVGMYAHSGPYKLSLRN